MSESHNSQSGKRFTGQRLKVLRPDTYRRVVELLAEPREQVPLDHIARLLHVSRHTIYAIEKAEAASVAQRKESLLRKALRLAHKAIDRIDDQIQGANITQATVAFGVATDKAVLLSGGPASRILCIDITPVDIHARYNELCRLLTQSPDEIKTINATVSLPDADPKALPDSTAQQTPSAGDRFAG